MRGVAVALACSGRTTLHGIDAADAGASVLYSKR
jgi:hypothetical protein